MANKFTRYLSDFGKGFVDALTKPKGGMANYRHATRLFVDDTYRLAPKTKFLFYVYFDIDEAAKRSPSFTQRQHGLEFGMLCKSSDLPKFTFESVTKNQYNRKKIVYKGINYDPLNLTFHDDNANVVNSLWALYYGYYISDRNLDAAAYNTSHYRSTDTPIDNFRYGLDNDVSLPFLKSVTIYTLSRRRFMGYTLVNPKIKTWTHGQVDYGSGEPIDSQMTLEYEAVRYSAGNVGYNSPQGFATLHYDSLPSPLSVAGGGVANVFGPGGVIDGLESVFGSVTSGAAFSSPQGFLGTVIAGINTARNIGSISSGSFKGEIGNILSGPAGIAAAGAVVSGVIGAVFPKSNRTVAPEVTASPKKVIATAAFTGAPVTAPGE